MPVPAGQDGKVWWLDSLAMGRLHFFNAPNYIAASAGALLVPREVAQQDRLHIAEGKVGFIVTTLQAYLATRSRKDHRK